MTDPIAPEQTPVDEDLVCYRHPDRPTKLRCSRCEVPICGECATPAPVGQHCPECVADAGRAQRRVRTGLQSAAPAVFVLIAVNVVVFVLQQTAGDEFTKRFWMDSTAIQQGQWWRLITSTFLHDPTNYTHILFNMMSLYFLGPTVEGVFGTPRFVAMYFVSGLAGSAASYGFGQCGPALGASGAIFGVAGMLLVILYHRRATPMVAGFLRRLLFLLAINVVIGVTIPGIDVVAHGGGFAGGLALGMGAEDSTGKPRPARVVLTTLVLVALVSVGGVWFHSHHYFCRAAG